MAIRAGPKSATWKTGYLFYSENGFTEDQQSKLEKGGIMFSTAEKQTAYETKLDT